MAIIPTQAHSTLLEPGPEELQDGHEPRGEFIRAMYQAGRVAGAGLRTGAPVWSHLKSALQRDGYESLVLDAREDADENR
jgi:hypothetical protein